MKRTFKKIFGPAVILLVTILSLSSCYETRYVRTYNHHTRGWYARRNVPPPVGVNFEVERVHRRY